MSICQIMANIMEHKFKNDSAVMFSLVKLNHFSLNFIVWLVELTVVVACTIVSIVLTKEELVNSTTQKFNINKEIIENYYYQ